MTSGITDGGARCLGSLIDGRQYISLVDHSRMLDDLHDSLQDWKMIEIVVDDYKARREEYVDIMATDTDFQCSYGLEAEILARNDSSCHTYQILLRLLR